MDGIILPIKHFRYSNNFLIISIWCCSSNKHIFTCENSNAKIRVSVLLSDLHASICQAHWFMFSRVLYNTVKMQEDPRGTVSHDRNQELQYAVILI